MITAKDIFDQINTGTGTKIGVGVHANVKLSGVDVGDKYIDFNFVKDDLVHNKRIWFPSDKIFQNDGESEAEARKRDLNDRLVHIAKFLHIFKGEEVTKTLQAPTFAEYAERAAEMLNEAKNTATLNLKLIYDKEGRYSTFGRFANYVEKYEEGKEPRIKFSDWEIENRSKKSASIDDDIDEPSANSVGNLV